MRPRAESAAAAAIDRVDPGDSGRSNGAQVGKPRPDAAQAEPTNGHPIRTEGFGDGAGLIERLMSPDRWRDLLRHDSIFWRRAIEAGVVHGPDAFVRYSPPLFGLAFALALPGHRRAVLENLRRVMPGRGKLEDYTDMARVFATFASCLTELFVAGSDRGDRLHGIVVDDHHYVKAAEKGRGVIAATAHTGGWQAAGALLQSLHDPDVLVVMQRERDEKAQALHDGARARGGIRVAHIGEDPLDALPLLSHLRRGGVVAMQIDRLPRGMRGRKVELFGQARLVPEGPLMLAALSGAPIVPVFTRRLGYMTYEVFIAPAITLPRKPTPAELDEAAQRAIGAMALYVRANPTQWFHFDVEPGVPPTVGAPEATTQSNGAAEPTARRG